MRIGWYLGVLLVFCVATPAFAVFTENFETYPFTRWDVSGEVTWTGGGAGNDSRHRHPRRRGAFRTGRIRAPDQAHVRDECQVRDVPCRFLPEIWGPYQPGKW